MVRNVASLVQRPRQEHREMLSWSLPQTRAFLAHVEQDRLFAALLLSLHGLRRGKVLGLRWSNIDLEGGQPTLAIRRTRVLVDSTTVVSSEPKTARGRRTLPLLPHMGTALRGLKTQQTRERLLAGAAYTESGLSALPVHGAVVLAAWLEAVAVDQRLHASTQHRSIGRG